MTQQKRGLFGLGRRRPVADPGDERVRGLRHAMPLEPDEPAISLAPDAVVETMAAEHGEIVFTAGPRMGARVEINGDVVSLDEGKSLATIWRNNDRFLLRHNGKQVHIGGATPSLRIIVLEDGDEIAVGESRARFLLVAPAKA